MWKLDAQFISLIVCFGKPRFLTVWTLLSQYVLVASASAIRVLQHTELPSLLMVWLVHCIQIGSGVPLMFKSLKISVLNIVRSPSKTMGIRLYLHTQKGPKEHRRIRRINSTFFLVINSWLVEIKILFHFFVCQSQVTKPLKANFVWV